MKKKKEHKLEMGYCPFESRYNGLYRDTGLGRCDLGAAWGPQHDRAVLAGARDKRRNTVGWATIQPATQPAHAQGRAARVRGPGSYTG